MNRGPWLRVQSYAPEGDAPDEYDWWIEISYDGRNWTRMIGDASSHYSVGVEMVYFYNRTVDP